MKKQLDKILFIIVILLYAGFVTSQFVLVNFSLFCEIIKIISFLIGLFTYVIISHRTHEKYRAKWTFMAESVFAVGVSVDMLINDSLVGLLFLFVICLLIATESNDGEHMKHKLVPLLAFAISCEVISVLLLTDYMKINTFSMKVYTSFVIDLIFLASILFALILEDEVNKKSKGMCKNAVKIVAGVSALAILVITLVSLEVRTRQYTLSLDEVLGGEKFYIVSASDPQKAISCSDGWSILADKFDNSNNQRFTVESTDTDGYYNIINCNGNAIDVVAAVYEDDNILCEYEKTGFDNQLWRIVPCENGYYMLETYNEDYCMSWKIFDIDEDNSICSATISSESNDVNRYFYFVNTKGTDSLMINWIVNGNRARIIALYVLAEITFGVMVVIIQILKRREKKDETNNSNTML